nr:hypothetical protein [uncultured Lachnoanaerobaculum sp.]
MQIVPMRDLKDTVQIEKKCQNGPVFVTKNGYGKLVVMNMEYYESKIAKIAEADFINEGIVDFANEKIDDGKEFGIYFMEFSEDVFMMNNISMKRKVGDIIEGNLFIAWITEFERTDKELMYVQKNEYSGIDAVVEITEVINEFTYYAKNSIVDRDIILDMEKDMDLKKGDRIYIEGSLQIELEEYKERLGLLEDWKR